MLRRLQKIVGAEAHNNHTNNKSLADFVRAKIRETVRDPKIADKLMPDHFVMTKRPVLENGYFEAYNRDNVELVDLREDPIERFTESSVVTSSGEHPIDMLVLATGYDAISGSMLRLNPKGRGGVSLKDRWTDRYHVGPRSRGRNRGCMGRWWCRPTCSCLLSPSPDCGGTDEGESGVGRTRPKHEGVS